MSRRNFLLSSLVATAGWNQIGWCGPVSRKPRILLRSSWQTVNIGDIAHTPGVLALLEKELPEADVWLWPSDVRNGVRELLLRRFPNLKIVQSKAEVAEAFNDCDFLLHGSGPSLVARRDVSKWRAATGKPFGVWGITVSEVTPELKELLSAADFVFFRDSVSLKLCRRKGVTAPVMAFGPDGAFNVDVADETSATAFLQANKLEPGGFLCCLSRLRHTPYWKVKNRPFDPVKHQRNEAMRERDHAPIRAAIEAVVRQTDKKVLLCPEDQTQMAVGKQNLYDRLPEDVQSQVVWRDKYWLTDEAVSVYRQSAGLFGSEMHSPIMAIGNGVPAVVCRFAEQTSKGTMWRDIGLNDWLFNLDNEPELAGVAPTVLSLVTQRQASLEKVHGARTIVTHTQRNNLQILKQSLIG